MLISLLISTFEFNWYSYDVVLVFQYVTRLFHVADYSHALYVSVEVMFACLRLLVNLGAVYKFLYLLIYLLICLRRLSAVLSSLKVLRGG